MSLESLFFVAADCFAVVKSCPSEFWYFFSSSIFFFFFFRVVEIDQGGDNGHALSSLIFFAASLNGLFTCLSKVSLLFLLLWSLSFFCSLLADVVHIPMAV